MGRPTKYDPAFCSQIVEWFDRPAYTQETRVNPKTGNEYIERVPNDLPTLEGFAKEIGVHRETLNNWAKEHSAFFDAITRAKDIQKDILVQNGLLGHYKERFAIFMAVNNTDLVDTKVKVNAGVEDLEGLGIGMSDAELERIARGQS